MASKQGTFLPTRRSLLQKIKDPANNEAWQEFYDLYSRLIYGVAIKAGLHHDEAQEVVSETMQAVSRNMPGFEYDPAKGKFKGWLLKLTHWRIGDQFRKRGHQMLPITDAGAGTRSTPTVARIPDPHGCDLEAIWEAEWGQNLLGAALKKVKLSVSSLQYQIFDLLVLKEMPVEKVTAMLGITRQRVYVAKLRVGRRVAKEIRRLEAP